MTMFYCPSCRQNLDVELKKNHNYLPFHKKWRDELISRIVTRVSESRFFLKNVMRSQPKLEESFSCPFCEEEIDQSQNKTIWFVSLCLMPFVSVYFDLYTLTTFSFALFKHLSQATHLDKMSDFLRTTGAADSLVQKCSITKEEFRTVSCGP